MQHFLYFLPEPQLHGSLAPILGAAVAFSPGLPLTSGLKVLSLCSAKLWSVALAESTWSGLGLGLGLGLAVVGGVGAEHLQ